MKCFITFGAGQPNFYGAATRLKKQAIDINLFDKIIAYTDDILKNCDDFWNNHSNFIENNKRGYGYWIWKPYLIKKTMESMQDGDILMYLDSGCEIDMRKRDNMVEYFDIIQNDYIIGCHIPNKENAWCKMDLILKLGMLDEKYLNTTQRQAGALLFLVCDKTRNIVNEWYELSTDYHNIDDTPSVSKNLNCFVEHRHDQSIFSLLSKKYEMYSKHSLEDCIEYKRNRTGISAISIPEIPEIPEIPANRPVFKQQSRSRRMSMIM